MAEKTEAQKRAQQTYMKKFAVARVRMEQGKYTLVQEYAKAHNESVSSFINRLIDNEMKG